MSVGLRASALSTLALALIAGTASAQTIPKLLPGPAGTSVPYSSAFEQRGRAATGAAFTELTNAAGPVGSANPMAVISVPDRIASTADRSAPSVAGGVAQTLLAANTNRRSFFIFNPNASGTCWVSVTTTAAANGQGSVPVPAQGGFGMEANAPTGAISALCPVTGQALTAWESSTGTVALVTATADDSVPVTTGGTAQTLIVANTARRAFYIFNPSTTGTCWASVTTTAAVNGQGSFPLPPLSGFGMESNAPLDAISALCPTAGQILTAWESQ